MSGFRSLGLMIATVAVGGCGTGVLPPATAPPPPGVAGPTARLEGVCSLVPDIETIVGRQLVVMESGDPVETDTYCRWGFNDFPTEAILMSVGRPERYDEDAGTYTTVGGDGEVVTGVGDAALLWRLASLDETRLIVKTAGHALSIGVALETGDEAAIATSIARSALSRLSDFGPIPS